MRKGIFFSIIACVGVVIASCGTSKKATASPVSLDGEWSITEVDGKMLSSVTGNSSSPTIGFDTKAYRVYGNSGCNRMMGHYTTEPGKAESISFETMGSTRMACPDMETEQKVLNALSKVKSFKVISCSKDKSKGCKIALCDENGKTVVMIEKVPVNIMALKGIWNILEVNGKPVENAEKEPFIGFDVEKKQIYGWAGCNNINGTFEQENKSPLSLNFGPIAATMMACADMNAETAILNALNSVKSFNIIYETKAGLYDANGNQVLTLIKKIIVE